MTPDQYFRGIACVSHYYYKSITTGIKTTYLTNDMAAHSLLSAGGDMLSTLYDAEIHSINKYLRVYRSDVGGSGLLTKSYAVKTAMLIRLSKNQLYVTNYEGYSYYKEHNGLFAFDTMYMGLNRVIRRLSGSPVANRKGRGLCSVCIYFLKDTVRSLHDVLLTTGGGGM